jgi:DNA polymerase I-like protein with 3'-5' exonuclease and polymerase domains
MVATMKCALNQGSETATGEIKTPGKKIGSREQAKANNMDYHFSVEDAQAAIKSYFKQFKGLKTWLDKNQEFIAKNGYTYSFFGRKRRLPEAKAPNAGVAKHAIRSGVNFLVQSVASDINILGLIDLIGWVEESGYDDVIKPFTVVHDSIVSEVREDLVPLYIANAKRCIQADRGLSIPGCPIKVDFEVGPSWGELYDEKEYFSKIQ